MTDEDLMLAVRTGDLSRLEPLFDRHHRPLFDYLARMTGDAAVAEDLLQDVFVRILKYRHTFRQDSQFQTWAFRIARNVRTDYFQTRRVHEPLEVETPDPVDHAAGVVEQFQKERQASLVRRALMLMREDQRELIVLARYRGMKYEAIAELLGVEVGTVKVRMHRAVRDLRDIFVGLSERPCSAKQSASSLLMV